MTVDGAAQIMPAPKRRVNSREVYNSPWMTVREDSVRLLDGSATQFVVVSRRDFVVVICPLPDGRLVLTEQYRYAVGQWSIELPQGGIEPGESAGQAAVRELAEETGWLSADPEILPSPLFEAGDWATQSFTVVRVRPQRLNRSLTEPAEAGMRSFLRTPSELWHLVAAGQIRDAASLAAIALYSNWQSDLHPLEGR